MDTKQQQPATVDTFSSAPVAMHHPLLGDIHPGWNRGLDPVKLQVLYDAQKEPGVVNYLHRKSVPCTRDSDGFVWSDAANDFVAPSKAAAVVPPAAAATTSTVPINPEHKTPDAPQDAAAATSPGAKFAAGAEKPKTK
jgi:hypothetical protein